jgi:hypothetical protein
VLSLPLVSRREFDALKGSSLRHGGDKVKADRAPSLNWQIQVEKSTGS